MGEHEHEMPEGMVEIVGDIAKVLRRFESQAMGDLMDATAATRQIGVEGMGTGLSTVGMVWLLAARVLGWGPAECDALMDLLAGTYERHLTAAGMGPEDV